MCEEVGEGVADEEADGGGDPCQQEGTAKGGGEFQHIPKIVRCEAALRGGEGVNRDDEDGGDYKKPHPAHIGVGNGFILHPLPPHPR